MRDAHTVGLSNFRFPSGSWRKCCISENFSMVPLDEIATAIAAARGALLMIALRLGKVSIAERPESRGADRYDGCTHILFDR